MVVIQYPATPVPIFVDLRRTILIFVLIYYKYLTVYVCYTFNRYCKRSQGDRKQYGIRNVKRFIAAKLILMSSLALL